MARKHIHLAPEWLTNLQKFYGEELTAANAKLPSVDTDPYIVSRTHPYWVEIERIENELDHISYMWELV